MKDSTVRTILRRLEEKGYATHDIEGRTFVYRARVEPRSVAAEAVRSIVDRFCAGSVEDLLVGMVADEIVSPQKLKQLAERIAKSEASKRKTKSN
jgi:predicted transcriptional regulator